MKVLKTMKRALLTAALAISFGNLGWGQIVVTEGFEESCSSYQNPFYLGCIPNWISASGTPDTYSSSSNGTAPQGSRFVNCYATWDYAACTPPERSEGIALNYPFQAGVTYQIRYKAKGYDGMTPSVQTHTAYWLLTSGLVNQTGGICAPGEATPPIPASNQPVPNNVSFNSTSWTSNTHTFTPTANFSQLWFRQTTTSSVQNAMVHAAVQLDDFVLEIICTPTIAITGPASVCQGSPISYTGSVTNGCSITNNVWTVVETDQYGNVVTGATEWWSPWASGNPGTLNIPSAANGGPTMTCGKYYRIKLAVQNPYTNWTETTKIIYVNCPPSFKLKGSTSKICTGDQALLNATLNSGVPANYTLNWTPIAPAGPSIYNGPMAGVAVTPSVSTTYLATVTDNITGCSATQVWNVTVVNNDPSFSLNVNTTNPNYFTLGLTANDPNGYNNSGFYYSLSIEELNGSGTPYYSDGGTNCWWNYPNVETFQGYVSTGTGTYSQMNWNTCPNPAGQFLYNHTYRITRIVWNDQCPQKQFSMIVTPVKSGNGIEVYEDTKAPDYTSNGSLGTMENHSASVEIYPNPSNDKVTISTPVSDATEILITDLSGREVYRAGTGTNSGKIELSVSEYTPGTYFVHVLENDTIKSTNKLVITK